MGTKLRAIALVFVLTAGFLFVGGNAHAIEITVACGDVTALRNAITTANATPEADTIQVTGGPCNFDVGSAVVTAPSGNIGLPIITRPLTIEGDGATIRRTGATFYRLVLASTPDFVTIPRVELRDLTISGGRLTGTNQNGGGLGGFLADVVLDGVTLAGNQTAGRGGAVAIAGGSLDINHSVVAFNVATFGSGVYTAGTASSNDITRSSFYFNSVNAGGNSTILVENGSASIENSTIAGNAAGNALAGVTAFTSTASTPASVAVRSSTLGDNGVSGNTAPGNSLLTAAVSGGTATIAATDTVVVDADSVAPTIVAPCAGNVVDGGGNVEWPTTTCGFDTQANPQVAYQFGGLAGAELFARLGPTSEAIDVGGNDCPATDQRGEPRPEGDACDAGSFETNPPETTADGPDGPTNDPEITFTSDEAGSTFQCSVDSADPVVCTSPFEPPLSDGEHTVTVTATDSEGYFDPSPASVTFVVDTMAPVVEITDSPASPTNDNTAMIEFTVDDEDADVTCQVDDGEPADCSSPFTTEALSDGEHTITVSATDAAGNTGTDSVTFVVDAAPPDTTITSGPSGVTHSASATFTFESDDDEATFECRVDGGDWDACTSPHTVTVQPGVHTFEVRAVDSIGNVDPTPAARTWEYQVCRLLRIGPLGLFGIVITVCL